MRDDTLAGDKTNAIPSIYGAWTGLPKPIEFDLLANAKPRCVRAGQTLFEAGDAADGFYLLKSGLLKVILASPDGDEVIIALLVPGTVVGDVAVIDGLLRAATVLALLDSDLLFVTKADFDRCALRHPEIYRSLARILANRLRETNDTICANMFLTVKARVARALLQIAKILGRPKGDGGISIPDIVRQRDLAAMAGVTRETVNRILAEWERSKLVIKSAHTYMVTDSERLARELKRHDL